MAQYVKYVDQDNETLGGFTRLEIELMAARLKAMTDSLNSGEPEAARKVADEVDPVRIHGFILSNHKCVQARCRRGEIVRTRELLEREHVDPVKTLNYQTRFGGTVTFRCRQSQFNDHAQKFEENATEVRRQEYEAAKAEAKPHQVLPIQRHFGSVAPSVILEYKGAKIGGRNIEEARAAFDAAWLGT